MRDVERNQFVGFMVSGGVTAVLLYFVATLGSDTTEAKVISDLSPWLGGHLTIIRWIAITVVLVGGALFPLLSMMRDDGRLEILGIAASKIIAAVLIPLACFAAGAVWYSSHH